MAFDFPDSPVDGETFTDATSGAIYPWNGYAWKAVSSGGGGTPPVSGDYVLKAGDTMSGALYLPGVDPVLPEEAANKQYVDAIVSLGHPAAAQSATECAVVAERHRQHACLLR